MNPVKEYRNLITRRHFFSKVGLGLGGAVAAMLLPPSIRAAFASEEKARSGGLPGVPHFAPKAKRAIYLFMSEGPSQMDLFDYKSVLAEMYDKDMPESIRMGQRLTTMTSGQARLPVAPSIYKFAKHDNGGDGMWVSELLPNVAKMVGDLAFIRSLHTEAINHDPAITFFCTGDERPGKPSLGSWLSYGLGTENENLPSFVVMTPSWTGRKDAQALYNRLWGSGFLPSEYQGVYLRTAGDPVLFLNNPNGVTPTLRKQMMDSLVALNEKTYQEVGDPETHARIAQYEMAFRMQSSVPEITDLSKEPDSTFELYGPESKQPGTFAYCCLLARRLIEKDVRFIQLFHRGWDQHFNLTGDLPKQCHDIDQPCYALIQDLKQRGLLDDTLVVWGGEFGRTIYCQGPLSKENYGRDHHPKCFTMWMAGAGVKGGVVYGETDDFSYNIVKDPVHVRDINATILHQLGIDHNRLTYKFQGLDQRLVGVDAEAHVINGILA